MGNSSSAGYNCDGSRANLGPCAATRCRRDEPVHSDAVMCVVQTKDSYTLSGSKDQKLVLYDYKNGSVKQIWTEHEREITKVAYASRLDAYFSGSRDKAIFMWETGSPDPVMQFRGHDLVVTGLAVNAGNTQLCSGSRDNSLRMWDLQTGKCILQNSISRNLVTHVCWAENTDIIAQTGEDKELKIWDARSLTVVQTFARKQHIQNMCDVTLDNHYCVTCSNGFQGNGCEATLWDLRTNNIVHEFKGHTEGIGGCTFMPPMVGSSQVLVATCSNDCTVRIWDRDSAACLASLHLTGSGPLTSIAMCPDSKLCVSSFKTGVHILQGAPASDGMISLQEIVQY